MTPYRVPAVESASRVLALLIDTDDNGASMSELCAGTGISKSTMHNLLGTLQASGYVRRTAATRRYHLGGALIALGAAASRQVHSLTLAVDRLAHVAAAEGVSAAVGMVMPGGEAQITHRAYPPDSVHVGIRVGSRYGLFDGAIGKCLLAAMDPLQARRVVESEPIPAHTDRTVTEPESLWAEIEAVRARGWAASIGEYNGNIAVAATIHDADGAAEALLLALDFSSDASRERVPALGEALRREARLITEHAGGVPHGAAGTSPNAAQPNTEGALNEQLA